MVVLTGEDSLSWRVKALADAAAKRDSNFRKGIKWKEELW